MRIFTTILLKELKEIVRDRASLIIIILPIVLFPILRFGLNQLNQTNTSEIRVALYTQESITTNLFSSFIEQTKSFRVVVISSNNPIKDLEEGKIDCYLLLNKQTIDFIYYSESFHSLTLTTKLGESFEKYYLQYLNKNNQSISIMGIADENGTQFDANHSVNKVIIPIVFLFLVFQCSSSFANDMFAGEKERGTIELLLLSATTKWIIYFAKLSALFLITSIQMILSILSFSISESSTQNRSSYITIRGIIIFIMLVFISSVISTAVSVFSYKMKTAQLLNEAISLLLCSGAIIVSIGLFKSSNMMMLPIINLIMLFIHSFTQTSIDLEESCFIILSNFVFTALIISISIHFMKSEKIIHIR